MEHITICVVWYERKEDRTPDYTKPHRKMISGANSREVLRKYHAFQENHDLAKYTMTQIEDIQ